MTACLFLHFWTHNVSTRWAALAKSRSLPKFHRGSKSARFWCDLRPLRSIDDYPMTVLHLAQFGTLKSENKRRAFRSEAYTLGEKQINTKLKINNTAAWSGCALLNDTFSTPCPKKTKQICFCQNFVKFPPILIIFGRKMGNDPNICEVHSLSTSPNLCRHTTVLNADVPNCYKTL